MSIFALFEHWLDDPAKITVGAVLILGIVGYHYITRWYFTEFRKAQDATIVRQEAEIARLREQCKQEREGRERLLTELERLASATEITAQRVAGRRR